MIKFWKWLKKYADPKKKIHEEKIKEKTNKYQMINNEV